MKAIDVNQTKRIIIGLIVVTALVTALLVILALSQKQDDSPNLTAPAETIPSLVDEESRSSISYRLTDIATENSIYNCRTAIDGRVYDVTDFIINHIQVDTLKAICGRDGSKLFKDLDEYSSLTSASRVETITWLGVLRYTWQDLQDHYNQPDNCYTIIDKHVYDISGYIADQPAQADELEAVCGDVGTNVFQQLDVYQELQTDQQLETIILIDELQYY